MRVVMVKPGQTGYISPYDLYSTAPGHWPVIMMSVCTTADEVVLGDPLEVYHNPKTHDFEVKMRPGVKASYHMGALIAPGSFFRVVLIMPDGTKVRDKIPDGYWQR